MQRIYNIDKWAKLDASAGLGFPNPRPRMVKLEVNAPVETKINISTTDAVTGEVKSVFLALVKGRDTIEFGSTGAFELVVTEGECFVYTADNAEIHHVIIDPVIFTTIAERAARNPELEYMMAKMAENMERRLAAQFGELEERHLRERGATSVAPATIAPAPAPQARTGNDPAPGVVEAVSPSDGATGTGDERNGAA